MDWTLAHIGNRLPGGDAMEQLTQAYLQRMAPYTRCEALALRSEEALEEWLQKRQSRTPVLRVLLDSRGKLMTSEAFADWLGVRRDQGTRHILFAIGPASGWSEEMRRRADLLLSLGPFTLAHALARLVLAEQLYRACTILAGHPYHTGH